MKTFLRFLLVAIGAIAVHYLAPWWAIVIVGFLVGLAMSGSGRRRIFATRRQPPSLSFLMGFFGVALVWGLFAWQMDAANASLLSRKIAQLLLNTELPPTNGNWFMIGISATIGGLLGGFSTMTGNLLGEALK